MFLSTVILVLQEILEAALLISLLLVLSRLLTRKSRENLVIPLGWLPFRYCLDWGAHGSMRQ